MALNETNCYSSLVPFAEGHYYITGAIASPCNSKGSPAGYDGNSTRIWKTAQSLYSRAQRLEGHWPDHVNVNVSASLPFFFFNCFYYFSTDRTPSPRVRVRVTSK